MGWGIRKEEFHELMDRARPGEGVGHGFRKVSLFYGFGDDGHGNADPVLSGKVAWEYVCRSPWRKTWQCRYIDFDKPAHIRLRPGAPPRPKGFYFAVVEPGDEYRNMTVSRARKAFRAGTGLGPGAGRRVPEHDGIQGPKGLSCGNRTWTRGHPTHGDHPYISPEYDEREDHPLHGTR